MLWERWNKSWRIAFCCLQEHAFESSQKYKEGKYIIELAHMVKENQWDWDKARVYRLDTKPAPLLIRPSTTCGSPDYDPWVIPEVEPVDFAEISNQQETCPSLLSCFTFFRRIFSFVWQCVWRWPWPKEQNTTQNLMQSATLSDIVLCQLIIFSLLTQGLLVMISLDSHHQPQKTEWNHAPYITENITASSTHFSSSTTSCAFRLVEHQCDVIL